jgi:hypothetical protein
MPTSVLQMVDASISVIQDGPRARALQKYLQKAGMLPSQARVHGFPQVEAVHAAIWALAILVGGRQTHVARAVQFAWVLPTREPQGWRHPALQDFSARTLARHANPGEAIASFGEVLCLLISIAAASPEGWAWVKDTFSEIKVWADGQVASLRRREGSEEHYQAVQMRMRASPDGQGPLIQTFTLARIEFLLALADMVARTRRDAARLGITVPVHEAYRALGVEPPPPPPSSSSDPASGSAGDEASPPETRKAAGTGIPTAVKTGQPPQTHSPAAQPHHTAHSSEWEGGKQSPPAVAADRSTSKGDRPDVAERRPSAAERAAA